MMLFDTNHDDIVIVPPKPDFAFLTEDEFSYSNLYCYDEQSDTNNCGTSSSNTATTTTTAASVSSDSNTTLSSSNNERSSSTVSSFDSSVFNNGAAANNNKHADTTDTTKTTTSSSSNKQRDPRNGAFTFQVHAEYDLLLHVQKDLDKHRSKDDALLSDIQLSKIILRSIDEYCLQKQWMYHIGSEKGVAIGRFLRGGAEKFLKRRSLNNGEVKKFVCVELGTYCGYSALVLASTLCQLLQDLISSSSSSSSSSEQAPFEFHIYTTEVSSKLLNVAQSVFRLAKMEHYITPILMPESTIENNTHHPHSMLSQTLLNQHNVSHIDFLLLDHAKHLYLDDLQDLENAKLLRAGSHVSADNVVFNRLDAYRDHMHKLVLEGVVESRLEEMNLEYSNNLKDGMEMTVYLKDPPTEENNPKNNLNHRKEAVVTAAVLLFVSCNKRPVGGDKHY
eukprot:CAMPEP_0201963804 /NCGR_PEP_ID=MMETSP0904-20121228/9600_1 /ASSEMBLY_ACC=CAM_ASM_000553 /TAXON_ID=420261 /ORGANISM="Thalassiosira antarctica, Strain CCMP982" /LENGTH=447 /DNA_ID=CAMNT_0048510523 /DNA_START=27 /DNA_END=1371 /DNA_ORIENTATION=+